MVPDPASATVEATRFSAVGVPVLAEGRLDQAIPVTGDLSIVMKVYAAGGENVTHAHRSEDHLFFVLGGQAEFHVGSDGTEVIRAERFDGVYLPRGCFYRFTSVGDENLVMLRVGSKVRAALSNSDVPERIGPDGKPIPGKSEANRYAEPRVAAGLVFQR